MAKSKDEPEISAELLGAIVIADLAQIEADAETHQDAEAQKRILTAVKRLRAIAEGEITSDLFDEGQAG